ncbi:MAG: hypothetical protein RR711_06030 [Bacteroides sp.]|uniref:hypothetical protein n=1 Tax=Bacteroides sp. TaxID=29523 RepID=UPI002FC6DBFF
MAANFLSIGDTVLFLIILLPCIYLFVFAWAAARKENKYPKTAHKHRYAILIPIGTDICEQEYPQELYDLYHYETLSETVHALDPEKYEMAVILGQGSSVPPFLLSSINEVYDAEITAIQLHHIIEPRSTRKLRYQAITEEVNQTIFRHGHIQMGLSSGCSSMDMAVELRWLQENLKSPKSNLAHKLLQQNIFIEYLSQVSVSSPTAHTLSHTVSRRKALSTALEAAIIGQWSYADKLFQRLIPSWKTLLIIIAVLAVATTSYNLFAAVKWWMLLLWLLFTISLAIPDYLIEDKKKRRNPKPVKI